MARDKVVQEEEKEIRKIKRIERKRRNLKSRVKNELNEYLFIVILFLC